MLQQVTKVCPCISNFYIKKPGKELFHLMVEYAPCTESGRAAPQQRGFLAHSEAYYIHLEMDKGLKMISLPHRQAC